MPKNQNLTTAKVKKDDEFYTRYEDVAAEAFSMADVFHGKQVYCNCDNPAYSAFWRFFHTNFQKLGLRGLTATFLQSNGVSFRMDYRGGADSDCSQGKRTILQGDGDFRSKECLAILQESDIAATNPPFSLLREYIKVLQTMRKDFLIVGNMNAVSYRDIFPLFQTNQIRIGETVPSHFLRPDGSIKKFGNTVWFTNLAMEKLYERPFLATGKTYTETQYPSYLNCNAVHVPRLDLIPEQYSGIMGVPISIFRYYNPNEFQILGYSKENPANQLPIAPIPESFLTKFFQSGRTGHYTTNMKVLCFYDEHGEPHFPYERILIQRKHPQQQRADSNHFLSAILDSTENKRMPHQKGVTNMDKSVEWAFSVNQEEYQNIQDTIRERCHEIQDMLKKQPQGENLPKADAIIELEDDPAFTINIRRNDVLFESFWVNNKGWYGLGNHLEFSGRAPMETDSMRWCAKDTSYKQEEGPFPWAGIIREDPVDIIPLDRFLSMDYDAFCQRMKKDIETYLTYCQNETQTIDAETIERNTGFWQQRDAYIQKTSQNWTSLLNQADLSQNKELISNKSPYDLSLPLSKKQLKKIQSIYEQAANGGFQDQVDRELFDLNGPENKYGYRAGLAVVLIDGLPETRIQLIHADKETPEHLETVDFELVNPARFLNQQLSFSLSDPKADYEAAIHYQREKERPTKAASISKKPSSFSR